MANWGNLHTKSSYFEKSSYRFEAEEGEESNLYWNNFQENAQDEFNRAIGFLEQKELIFYQSIFSDATGFEDFMAKLRLLFNTEKDDAPKIMGFSNAAIRGIPNLLPDFILNGKIEYKIKLTGDLAYNLGEELQQKLSSKYCKVDSNKDIFITVHKDTVEIIKNIFNKNLNTALKEKTPSADRIKQIINGAIIEATKNIIDPSKGVQLGASDIFVIKTEPEKTQQTSGDSRFKVGIPPFKWSKSQIDDLLKGIGDPEDIKEFEDQFPKAKEILRNFFMNECLGASEKSILKEAAEETWEQVVETSKNKSFFFEGENIVKTIFGNGGEFQLKLISVYVNKLLERNGVHSKAIGDIIGSDILNGEQPRSDFDMVVAVGGDVGKKEHIGFQVKNYNYEGLSTIDSNSTLGLVAPNLPDGLTDTIVNAYFNANIRSKVADPKTMLKTYLDTYYWQGMNLNINLGLDVNQTNTFYWVAGSTLIPGSRLLKQIGSENGDGSFSPIGIKTPTFDIKGTKYSNLNDDSFAKNDYAKAKEYWDFHGNKEETPTSFNDSEYEKYLSNIRIHTTFSVKSLYNMQESGKYVYRMF